MRTGKRPGIRPAPVPPEIAALLARPTLGRLLDVYDRDGEETRIIGGAVRDALLGEVPHEVDLATTMLPQEVMRRARAAGFKPVPTGIDHGTVTVVVAGEPFEITTLREDVDTDGRHAQVRFSRDFAQDAGRRDFTINALSLSRDGVVHDTTGGVADLAARRVRFIGDAGSRIREDYLRTLRFFRFHARFADGPPDRAGLHAAIAERAGLARLSRERVRTELLKLLAARRASDTIAIMVEAGLWLALTGMVPETGRLARLAASNHVPDPVLRLAALAVRLREDAGRLRDQLRLSNAEVSRLEAFAAMVERLHGMEAPLDARAIRRLAVRHGLGPLGDACRVLHGESRPCLTETGSATLQALEAGSMPLPRLPFSGGQIIRAGVAPGAAVGRLLAELENRWIADDCPTDSGQLAAIFSSVVAPEAS